MHTTIIEHFVRPRGPRSRPASALGAALVPTALSGLLLLGLSACSNEETSNAELIAQGKQTFRFDTFGDETKWTDALRMNEVINTVGPTTALEVGLKVDS